MGLSKAEPARWFQANLTVQKKSLFYKFHKTTCAWKGDTRVLNILAWLNNLWSPWPAATAAKGWLQFRAAVLSRMGTVKGTSQQHSEGTKKSQFTQKDKILGGMNPIMLLTREVIGFFFCYCTCYQSQKQHSWDSLASTCPLVPHLSGYRLLIIICMMDNPRDSNLGKDSFVSVAKLTQQRWQSLPCALRYIPTGLLGIHDVKHVRVILLHPLQCK